MTERFRRDGWLLAPWAIVAFGVVAVAAHATAGGFESWWSDTRSWDPSPLARVGSVALVATLFIAMPLVAMAVRRSHPGWTLMLLLPSIAVCISPLLWLETSWWLLVSAVGIATLVGALVNLARHSVQVELGTPTPTGG